MSRFTAPILLSFFLATAAGAEQSEMIKEITVEMDLAAVVNPAAAERFGTLATDLQGAIAARLVDRIADEGRVLSVDISEAELSNAFTEAAGLADTKLVGEVHIEDENDKGNFNTYTLTVTVENARAFFPADIDEATLTASSDAFYASLISAFADEVAKRIDE